jgi:hypothetical protein
LKQQPIVEPSPAIPDQHPEDFDAAVVTDGTNDICWTQAKPNCNDKDGDLQVTLTFIR